MTTRIKISSSFSRSNVALGHPESTPSRHAMQLAQTLVRLHARSGIARPEGTIHGVDPDESVQPAHRDATDVILGGAGAQASLKGPICRQGFKARWQGGSTSPPEEAC